MRVAVRELERILNGDHKGLALSAQEALKGMINDDSERVRREVARVMEIYTKPQPGNITKQEKPLVVKSDITPTPVVETETPQPEGKDEKKNIIQQPTIVSERSSTAISTRKPLLLWLLPAILVPVISGIVVSIIFFSNRQSIAPPPIVETQKKIEETSKPLEKVEKVPATEIKEIKFRSEPIENLSKESVKFMLRRYNFYCKEYDWNKEFSNPQGSGFQNNFEPQIKGGDSVILDHASSLMWQQSGSNDFMNYKSAQEYIRQLNQGEGFAGYRDWRLPTLEEAMSLMEPTQMNGDLYIDPKFDKQQRWIWTSDHFSASFAWVVGFHYGLCNINVISGYDLYVRAVR